MKKKLFSMLLVLALCVASAAGDFYVTDSVGNIETTLSKSESINLYIWCSGDDDDIIYFDYIIAATGPGTLSATVGTYNDFDPPGPNPNILATGRNPEYDFVQPGQDWTDPGNPVEIPNSYEMTGGADDGRLEPGLANPLAYVTLHCDNPGDVVITLTDIYTFDTSWDQVFPIMHGMIIHGVPEPATIALLCLGGLLVRKK